MEKKNIAEFKEQLRKLQEKKFNGLNTQQIFTYVRVYYSVYMMVSTNALDEEYGDRKIYLQKLKTLLKILLRRYDNTEDTVNKIQILYLIFFLMENVLCTYDCEKYLNEGAELIDKFIEQNHDTMTADNRYELIRLILVEWYGLIEEDDTDTPSSLKYAREHLNKWAATINNDGTWTDATDIQALRRIVLIAMNSTIMLDDQYETQLEKAYRNYCVIPTENITPGTRLSDKDLNKYILIYYALNRAPLAMSVSYTKHITHLAALITNHIEHTKGNPTLHTMCQCIHTDHMCQQVSDEVQEMLMGEM